MKATTPITAELTLRPSEFDPSRYARGAKYSVLLDVGHGAAEVALPVKLICGARSGKTLVVTAALHGDEFEGVRAVLDIFAELDAADMSGTLITVPVANPPAFWKGTRTSPLDDGNLARLFPGKPDGTPTEVIAFHLGESIIARADFFLDLHSGGVKLIMPSMVGYDANDTASRDAAMTFGAPVAWAHRTIPPGRTISFAASRGIPWLYTEARGAGRIDARDLQMFTSGIRNLLRHLKILPGAVLASPPARLLQGDGNIDSSIVATRPGFLIPAVELLEDVKASQELGRTVDALGQVVEVIRAPRDGTVAMIHVFPVVQPGEALFLVTGLLE